MKLFLAGAVLFAAQAFGQQDDTAKVPPSVVVVRSPGTTQRFRPNPDAVRNMIRRGVTELTGKTNEMEAWLDLLSPSDVVGIKVFSTPGPASGTRTSVVASVVEGLLAAGIPATNIVIWDKHMADLRLAGFSQLADQFGVTLAASSQAGYDPDHYYESSILGNLSWGDLEFGKQEPGAGRRSFLTKLLTRKLTKIISISPLLNHNRAGVCGTLYSLAGGSVDNFFRFDSDRERLAAAVPEIVALPELYDRLILSITDALLCQYEGSERGLLHYTTVLDELRFSKDPVALDVLSIAELEKQRALAGAPLARPNRELYANAGLLELGVNEPKRIKLRVINEGSPQTSPSNRDLQDSR